MNYDWRRGLLAALIWVGAAELSQVFAFSNMPMSIFWPPDGIAAGLTLAYGPRILLPIGAAIWLWNLARGMSLALATLGSATLVFALLVSWWLMRRERQRAATATAASPLAAMVRYYAIAVLPAVTILSLIGSWQFAPQASDKPVPDVVLVMAVSETLGILLFTRLAELTAESFETLMANARRADDNSSARLRRQMARRQIAWVVGLILLAWSVSHMNFSAGVMHTLSAARYGVFMLIVWTAYRGQAFFVHLVTALSAVVLLTLTPYDIRGNAWLLPDLALLLGSMAFLGFMASATMESRRQIENRLLEMAHHDPLTGWLNESGLVATLAESPRRGYLIGIDLQTLRHTMELIGLLPTHRIEKDLAALLQHDLKQARAFARPRESFFVILLDQAEDAYACLPRLGTLLNQRHGQGAHNVRIQASVGVLPLAERPTGESVADLLAALMLSCQLAAFRQEHALTYDRDALSGRWDDLNDMVRSRRDQLALLEELKEALQHEPGSPTAPGLWLACQPIRSAHESTSPDGIEVLLRWTLRDGTQQTPDGFLPLAERYGLMPQVDRWVVSHALRTVAAFEQVHACIDKVAINLSGSSLSNPLLYDFISRTLAASGLPPSLICLEITETAGIVQRAPAIALLNRLRGLGLATSLDDFGTGLASFDYLTSLPLDCVKIDGRFIRNVQHDRVSLSVVTAVCAVARVMKLKTIAEFVETPQQCTLLENCGVDYLQGYGIGKPVYMVDYLRSLPVRR